MHVHAHPDDESSKGAASTARYVAEGVDVHVATCTGGERGSILNPKMDRPDILENITEIRRQEMERARDILGVRQNWLGFVDSGWPEGDPKPPLPRGCFALVPLEEELSFLESYVALMTLRFGAAFQLVVEDRGAPRHWLVPPTALQGLVENALKHNQLSEARPLQIAICGPRDAPATAALSRAVAASASLPNLVLSLVAPDAGLPPGHPAHGKGMIGTKPAAYVCDGPVCSPPFADPAALTEDLKRR